MQLRNWDHTMQHKFTWGGTMLLLVNRELKWTAFSFMLFLRNSLVFSVCAFLCRGSERGKNRTGRREQESRAEKFKERFCMLLIIDKNNKKGQWRKWAREQERARGREREKRGGVHLADLFLHSLQPLQHCFHVQYGRLTGCSVVCFWFLCPWCGWHVCVGRLSVWAWVRSVRRLRETLARIFTERDVEGKWKERSWAGWWLDL